MRTESIQLDGQFSRRFADFIAELDKRADYYLTLAEQLEKNPLLAIDYLRRSFLLSGDAAIRTRARQIFDQAGLGGRAKDSVEQNLVRF